MQHDLTSVLPSAYHMLSIPAFHCMRLEMQMTSHGDGDYFKAHNDNGSPDCLERAISYVYYFDVERPRIYRGGELRIWCDGKEHLVIPMDNSVVFFNSSLMHEVAPVQCASKEFVYQRFTVNGWLRR
jgi:Rps23 Pro-64 3,4-dihydroxylase Tpa1-like proline 4-hydroxylase